MKIETRVVGDVVVLLFPGPIVIGVYDEFQWAVSDFLQGDRKKILLNLAGVPYVDWSGLMALVRVHELASKQGVKLKFSNLVKKVQDLLAITKLLTVLEVCTSEEEAIEEFNTPS